MAVKTYNTVVKECTFTNQWTPPGKTNPIYYHDILTSDNITIKIGYSSMNPDRLKPGKEITYSYDDVKKKWNLETLQPSGSQSSSQSKQSSARQNNPNNNAGQRKYSKPSGGALDYLGYCFLHAKDMVIHGKTSEKDVEDLIRIANDLFMAFNDTISAHEAISASIANGVQILESYNAVNNNNSTLFNNQPQFNDVDVHAGNNYQNNDEHHPF